MQIFSSPNLKSAERPLYIYIYILRRSLLKCQPYQSIVKFPLDKYSCTHIYNLKYIF